MVIQLVEEEPWRWRIDRPGAMRLPGIVFAVREQLPDVVGDLSLDQVASVAALSGIVGARMPVPDVYRGYGFPIGGVAATDVEAGDVLSSAVWDSTSPTRTSMPSSPRSRRPGSPPGSPGSSRWAS